MYAMMIFLPLQFREIWEITPGFFTESYPCTPRLTKMYEAIFNMKMFQEIEVNWKELHVLWNASSTML